MSDVTSAEMPATYCELAVRTKDTTHAEWESTLGTYESLRYKAPEQEEN